jgi:SNF2 family DNA or RNA helicase
MLKIVYLEGSHKALLTLDELSPVWPDVRRICLENTKDVRVVSDKSLIIPWWAFLNCKNALRLVLKKHGVGISPDSKAEKLLRESVLKNKLYKVAQETLPMSEEFIRTELELIGFKRELSDQQIRNVARLFGLPAGATFSVPGAGKTTEALALYYLKKSEQTKLLIVAPKNAFAAWEQQLAICVPKAPKITRLKGGVKAVESLLNENPEAMLITYQQLPNVLDALASYMSNSPFFMFLDESHRIKRGNDGVIGRTILNISHLPQAKLIMSGTPMPNSPSDLIPQINFLYPELRADTDNVVELIKPVYVRTTKEELGLKKPRFIMQPVHMSVGQRKLYDLVRNEEARLAESSLRAPDRNRLRAMGRSVMRMLQITSNPALLLKGDFAHNVPLLKDILSEGDSPKIKYVCYKVRQLASQKKKTIVWSTFVENVELLSQRLQDLGADYIHGGVEAGNEDDHDTREAKIKRFHDDPECYVLIANPAAAGEGISLHTVCHHAIYLDRNYNAAHFLQSVDRIHRFGLDPEEETNVEIVYCPDSVDESVERRLHSKINKMSEVLNDRSLNIEPEYGDEELFGEEFNADDIDDFINHLRGI